MHIPFNNQYIKLGTKFYTHATPMAVDKPSLIKLNEELAFNIGCSFDKDNKDNDDILASIFSGNALPEGAEPLAMAYSGHQFGHFSSQLGDGRAILLGESKDANGANVSVQLKGSGRTAYSRNGDGRSALGPILREYLVSEAMAKLNVPTTRALAAVTTGEDVVRERLLPGGVITRVASSFVRVGTFQYFASRDDNESIKQLADHVISTNYPKVAITGKPYEQFLSEVVKRQAQLIAQWMQLGFIHGVMNTDNMSIAGETIDYGPCAFMDSYSHKRVFSSIDRDGRYAYNNQANIGLWNLIRFAETLLPLLANDMKEAVEVAQSILKSYMSEYETAWLSGMRHKCGLNAINDTDQADKALINSLLEVMHANDADFTLTFHHLSQLRVSTIENDHNPCRDLFKQPAEFDQWEKRWRKRLTKEIESDKQGRATMQKVNPVYIPRNHQIEAAIRAAEDHNDFTVFHDLHEVLQDPFTLQSGKEKYQHPPEPDEIVHQTFCGT